MKIEELCNKHDIPFIEEAFRVEDIGYADEMFMTSSTAEILPILKVDTVTVGEGEPGKITRELQRLYEEDAGIRTDQSLFLRKQA